MLRRLLSLAFLVLPAFAAPAVAQRSCAVDQVCPEAIEQCRKITFNFTDSAYDFFNIRYNTASGEKQSENKSGTYTINNAKPGASYYLKVQGCKSRTLASSKCTPWNSVSITTTGDYGPDTCAHGLVWRDATAGDHVCVSVDTRKRVATDNAAASQRRTPGAYGPDTCKAGFVWRAATQTDHVCVKPDERTRAAGDNSRAARGKLCP